jgi:hypothetical protein
MGDRPNPKTVKKTVGAGFAKILTTQPSILIKPALSMDGDRKGEMAIAPDEWRSQVRAGFAKKFVSQSEMLC